MITTIKKIFLLFLVFSVSVSFSGCLNLFGSKDKTEEVNKVNEDQGVFKSIDGGKTWEHRVKLEEDEDDDNESQKEKFIDNVKISSMKMDPQDHNVLFLGTKANGLYKTENGADSWKKFKDKNGELKENTSIFDIEIEKGNSDIVYLAVMDSGRGMLLKSEDSGESWIRSYIISEAGKSVNVVKIDPINKNIVYIGTEQGGFIKSEDRGKTWYTVSWFPTGVKDFIIDFQNNKGLIVRTTNKIYKILLIDADPEFIKTLNGGEILKYAEPFRSLGGKDIFIYNEKSIWMSLNMLMRISLSLKIHHAQISSMTIDNKNPLVFYITYQNLILVTKDGGYTWEKMNTITPALTALGTIPQVKQIGMTDDIIYYGAGNVLYKSENKGITWSNYDIPIKGDVRYTVSDHEDSDIIYVGAFYDPPKKKKKGIF